MKEILRKIYYSIIRWLPDKLVINFENYRAYGRKLPKNKNDIKYFGEKIQWLKLYGHLEKYNDYVDKYLVREYIKKSIGEKYLIPLLGVYNNSSEIVYDELPDKFVLKINNGSAMNIIVKDKNKINKEKINKKLDKWLKNDYSKIKKEYQYKNVERKIICEKYISDSNGELIDYKFFCFDGEPLFVKADLDRFTEHKVNFYDMNWNFIDMRESFYKNCNRNVSKPDNFDEMVEIAKILSKDFQFVRVDLYDVDGNIYFGELTFTPASGKNPFYPLEKDVEISRKIKLGE